MVIQENMPVSGIVEIWSNTKAVFDQCQISVGTNKTLKEIVPSTLLPQIIKELNYIVGSSDVTCVEGG